MTGTPPTDRDPSRNLNCPQCKAILPSNAVFCSFCGAPFDYEKNGEREKHTEIGENDAQVQEVNTVRLPSLSQRHLKRWLASQGLKDNATTGQLDTSNSLQQNAKTSISTTQEAEIVDTQACLENPLQSKPLQTLPSPSTPSISQTWQQIPETEIPAFLSEELTVPSVPIPSTANTKKHPFSLHMKQQITQPLPSVSSVLQRAVELHPLGSSWLWSTIIIISAVAAGFVNFVFTNTPLRPFIIFWFLFICPGMAMVRFLHLKEPLVEWTLALALSLAIDAIIAALQLYAGRWSPAVTLSILIGLSLGGAILQLVTLRSAALSVSKLLQPIRSKRLRILLPILLTLLISIFVGASLRSYVASQSSRSITSTSVLQHKTVSHFIPTSTTSTITTGLYHGTIYNIAANITTKMSLTGIHLGNISGYFSGLHLNYLFKGRIDASKHIQFTVSDTIGNTILTFKGVLLSDGSISGSYCSIGHEGQCSGPYGYGLWSVVPTSSEAVVPLPFSAA